MNVPSKKIISDSDDQFVYRVSHDLQEPARGIKSFLMLLEKASEGQLDERGTLYLNKAREQSDILQAMLRDLLVLSRIGRSSNEFLEVGLRDLFGKLEKRYAKQLAGDKWAISIPDDFVLRGDGKEIVQLFNIICDNWAKHSPDALLSISHQQTEAHKTIVIAHSNTQVKQAVMQQMFEMFYTTRRQDGFRGTGLALVKSIVENLGGYVEAKGASTNTFTLYLHFPT